MLEFLDESSIEIWVASFDGSELVLPALESNGRRFDSGNSALNSGGDSLIQMMFWFWAAYLILTFPVLLFEVVEGLWAMWSLDAQKIIGSVLCY